MPFLLLAALGPKSALFMQSVTHAMFFLLKLPNFGMFIYSPLARGGVPKPSRVCKG